MGDIDCVTVNKDRSFTLHYVKDLWCSFLFFFSLFFKTRDSSSGRGAVKATNRKERKQEESVGSAVWKTSDFVVMPIKEQQVPVCLSA